MRGKKNGAVKQTLLEREAPTGSQAFYNDATASPGEDNSVTDPVSIGVTVNVEEALSGASEDGVITIADAELSLVSSLQREIDKDTSSRHYIVVVVVVEILSVSRF